MLIQSLRTFVGAAGIMCALHHPVSANESYPDKPIKLIMLFGAGSASDSIAPLYQTRWDLLGQRVLVDNRAGAGGNIGTAAAARSPADGYTLILAAPGPFVVNRTLEHLSYDPEKDFDFISPVATLVNVLVAQRRRGTSSGASQRCR